MIDVQERLDLASLVIDLVLLDDKIDRPPHNVVDHQARADHQKSLLKDRADLWRRVREAVYKIAKE